MSSTFAASVLTTITFVLVACGPAAAQSTAISVGALQGSGSSFNVPDGQGGTVPTGTWYLQQVGPSTWTFNPGSDTFVVPLLASFTSLSGSPTALVNLTEKGIFQFAQDQQGDLLGMADNIAFVNASIGSAPRCGGAPRCPAAVAVSGTINNCNCVGKGCTCGGTSAASALSIPDFPAGYMTFPINTLPPDGQFPPLGTDNLYNVFGFINVEGVPGVQQITITGSYDTAPLGSGSMTAANLFTSGASGSVEQIDIGVSLLEGTNSFFVALYTDSENNPGTLIAQWNNLSTGETFGQCCGTVTISGISGVSLTAGQSYFLVIGPTNIISTTSEMWNLNSTGATGTVLYAISGCSNGSGNGCSWNSNGTQTIGAFDLIGSDGRGQRLPPQTTFFSDLGTETNVYQCCAGLSVYGSEAGGSKPSDSPAMK